MTTIVLEEGGAEDKSFHRRVELRIGVGGAEDDAVEDWRSEEGAIEEHGVGVRVGCCWFSHLVDLVAGGKNLNGCEWLR